MIFLAIIATGVTFFVGLGLGGALHGSSLASAYHEGKEAGLRQARRERGQL